MQNNKLKKNPSNKRCHAKPVFFDNTVYDEATSIFSKNRRQRRPVKNYIINKYEQRNMNPHQNFEY